MALFGSKKKVEKKEVATEAVKKQPVVQALKNVIRRPRLTEKAATLSSQNVYTFDVTQGAGKHDVVRAVKALYKVTPVKINMVNTKGKKVSLKTRRGHGVKNNTRKAYVFLKKGDTIDFAA